jgi:phospholipase A1
MRKSVVTLYFVFLITFLSTAVADENIPEPSIIDDQENSSDETVLQKRNRVMDVAKQLPLVIQLYKPTYLLPYYHTGSPDYAVYEGDIPDNQKLRKTEVKYQISLILPLWEDMLGAPVDMSFAYTQLSYWQLYTDSPWFRETNYEPELIFTYHHNDSLNLRGIINHQSNGRGGDQERSWNRAIFGLDYAGNNWLFTVEGWALIFKSSSSDLHNPDITDYLGHGLARFSYKIDKFVLSAQLQNITDTDRIQIIGTISRQLGDSPLRIYVQGFSGYGQSMIEYQKHTNSFGIGFSVNDWII